MALLAYSTSEISTRSPARSGTAWKKSFQAVVALSTRAMPSALAPISRPRDDLTAARSSARSAAAT